MVSGKPKKQPSKEWPVFPVACWGLGLMAFVQLLIAGMALAARFESSRVVRIVEKEVAKPIIVKVPVESPQKAKNFSRIPSSLSNSDEESEVAPMPKPAPLKMPPIADARTEKMVSEARGAIVAGDMGKAVMKLEEALAESPDDPNVFYELGRVHEQMGVFDKASSYYEKVFQMGIERSGVLYQMAATKLRDGFERPDALLDKLSLGRVQIFNNPKAEGGQEVVLTIPVQKGSEEIDPAEMEVSVLFFDKTSKGEIVARDESSKTQEQWLTLPIDWVGGEETLRITYKIPSQDTQTEHLFGTRTYYGQVVSLKYKGEVVDVDAWPRDLVARMPNTMPVPAPNSGTPDFQDTPPPDLPPGSNLGVLPALPELPPQ